MKLYLAIALLVVAFAALTVAQEADPEAVQKTVEEKFQEFGTQFSEGITNFATKTKETFGNIQTSDIAVKTKSFFEEMFSSVKEQFAKIA